MSYSCPICKNTYDKKVEKCPCGFLGVNIAEYYPYFVSEAEREAEYRKETFGIYKFTKRVACGEIAFSPSELVLTDQGDKTVVYEAVEERGLAYIDCLGTEDKPTVADMGVIALRTGLYSLYLNTDYADSRFLDEGSIRMLFLGPDFKGFTEGSVVQYPPVRYIWVDPQNKFFTAENNVLYNKDKTVLIAYARKRPEAEYKAPESVRRIEKRAFFCADGLKRLYLPRGTVFDDENCADCFEIVYY